MHAASTVQPVQPSGVHTSPSAPQSAFSSTQVVSTHERVTSTVPSHSVGGQSVVSRHPTHPSDVQRPVQTSCLTGVHAPAEQPRTRNRTPSHPGRHTSDGKHPPRDEQVPAAVEPASLVEQQAVLFEEQIHVPRQMTVPVQLSDPHAPPGDRPTGAARHEPAQQLPTPARVRQAAPSGPHVSRHTPSTHNPLSHSSALMHVGAVRHTPLSHRPVMHWHPSRHGSPSTTEPKATHTFAAQHPVVHPWWSAQLVAHEFLSHLKGVQFVFVSQAPAEVQAPWRSSMQQPVPLVSQDQSSVQRAFPMHWPVPHTTSIESTATLLSTVNGGTLQEPPQQKPDPPSGSPHRCPPEPQGMQASSVPSPSVSTQVSPAQMNVDEHRLRQVPSMQAYPSVHSSSSAHEVAHEPFEQR